MLVKCLAGFCLAHLSSVHHHRPLRDCKVAFDALSLQYGKDIYAGWVGRVEESDGDVQSAHIGTDGP